MNTAGLSLFHRQSPLALKKDERVVCEDQWWTSMIHSDTKLTHVASLCHVSFREDCVSNGRGGSLLPPDPGTTEIERNTSVESQLLRRLLRIFFSEAACRVSDIGFLCGATIFHQDLGRKNHPVANLWSSQIAVRWLWMPNRRHFRCVPMVT